MRTLRFRRRRSGNVLVLALFMMIGMMGVIALAVDIGYLKVVNTEIQRSADSAAIAAANRLIEEQRLPGQSEPSYSQTRATAGQYAGLNKVALAEPALAVDDVSLGYMAYPFGLTSQLVTQSAPLVNGVRVRIRRTQEQNGEVSLFVARALGFHNQSMEGKATAAFVASFRGFRSPTPTGNVMFLPFALDEETWVNLTVSGTDNWRYDPLTGHVSLGADQIREVNLYPQGTGAPGNRGTVDIGSPNNSTCDIKRQIVNGISPADLAFLGGKIELGPDGTLPLHADTGVSAGFKAELESIIGQTRMIPIFRGPVSGNGNNAIYTIVGFAGVRVLDVKLTGNPNEKHVFVQPAYVKAPGAIPSTTNTSQFIYSPVCLVHDGGQGQ